MDANIQIKQSFFDPSQNKVTRIVLANGEELTSGNTKINLQSKVVNPSTKKQTIEADTNYDGLSKVIVAATSLEDVTVSIADLEAGKVIKPSEGFIGIKSITITE